MTEGGRGDLHPHRVHIFRGGKMLENGSYSPIKVDEGNFECGGADARKAREVHMCVVGGWHKCGGRMTGMGVNIGRVIKVRGVISGGACKWQVGIREGMQVRAS